MRRCAEYPSIFIACDNLSNLLFQIESDFFFFAEKLSMFAF